MSEGVLYHVTVAGRTHQVEIGPGGVTVDGTPVETDLQAIPEGPIRSLLLDAASHEIVARDEGRGRWDLHLGGHHLAAEVLDERTRAIRAMSGASAGPGGPKPLCAPMPGLVVRVEVAEGDQIEPGRGLIIIEAMKMENELRADVAGRITRIHVAAGEAVTKDQVLIDIEPLASGMAE